MQFSYKIIKSQFILIKLINSKACQGDHLNYVSLVGL